MESFTDELQDVSLIKIVQWCASTAMIFGGVVPYVPQYRQIRKSDNADGFSLHVCLALLVANILRILYWFGHGFELPLLAQSVVMIGAMLAMVKLCVEVTNRTQIIKGKDRNIWDLDPAYFWHWTHFQSYVEFLLLFTGLSSAALYLFHHSSMFVETLGFLAVFTESLLGVPQLLRNQAQRSTHGMSVGMVLMWLSGDSFKSLYFVVRSAPKQFVAAGILQVCVDIAILMQVWCYANTPISHTVSVSASLAPRHKAHELIE